MTVTRAAVCLVASAWLGPALCARAAAAQDTGRVVRPCDGRMVSAIDIRPQVPYYSGYGKQWRPLARFLASVHAVTTPAVVRSFLALHIGESCTELRRRESERILRVQPFLAEARITAYDDNAGGVRMDVFTADEISLTGGIGLRSAAPHLLGLRLGEANLAGQGVRVVAAWDNGLRLRDHFGGRITAYEVAGHPYEFTVQGNRNSLGGDWTVTLVHPFFTDLQRLGWIAEAGEVRTYVNFLNSEFVTDPALDFSRHFAQVGAVARVLGGPGHAWLFGATLSQETATPGQQPLLVSDSAVLPFVDPSLTARYAPLKAARVNALVGIRDVRFLRVTGFDALNGDQDVLVGIQAGGLLGRSVQVLGFTAQDLLVAGGLSAGTGNAHSYLGLQGSTQERFDLRVHHWDNILTAGRLAYYWKPSPVHTVIASAEYGVGLDQQLPFALTLGDLRGGVRGFHKSDIAGGERMVARLEERWLMGPVQGLGELGLAAFSDAGRIWARGVPFGANSPTEVSVGLSLLAAVPIRSKRIWRFDLAIPVTHDPSAARYEIRFSNSQAGPFYLEPRDVTRSRIRSVPTSIFEYPPR